MIKYYHNPRCSKSREGLELLKKKGQEVEVIEYLHHPPKSAELKAILIKLGIKAEELVRKGEELYKSKYKGKSLTEDQWIKALCENPVLIERPIVISGDKAVIGRPPEKIIELL